MLVDAQQELRVVLQVPVHIKVGYFGPARQLKPSRRCVARQNQQSSSSFSPFAVTYLSLSLGLEGTALCRGSNSSSCWMMDLALTCTPEILMLIPRRFPGPLAGISTFSHFVSSLQTYHLEVSCAGKESQTFNWVLFKVFFVLLHRRHTAGVNQLSKPLQICDGFVHQLRVSGDGLQPGNIKAGGEKRLKRDQRISGAKRHCNKKKPTAQEEIRTSYRP